MAVNPVPPLRTVKIVFINVLSLSTECLHKHMVLSHLMQWAQLTTETPGYTGVIACVSTHLLPSWFESHSLLPFFPYYLHNNFILFWITCTNGNILGYNRQEFTHTDLQLDPIHSATFSPKILNPKQIYLWSASYSLLFLKSLLPACVLQLVSVCFSNADKVMSSLS